MFLIPIYYFFPNKKAYPLSENRLYPVRNNAPLLPPGQRPSGPAALRARLRPGFRLGESSSSERRAHAPLGFESQRLEFLTGFTNLNS